MTDPETPVRDQVRELEAREQRSREMPARLRAVAPESRETRRITPMPEPPDSAPRRFTFIPASAPPPVIPPAPEPPAPVHPAESLRPAPEPVVPPAPALREPLEPRRPEPPRVDSQRPDSPRPDSPRFETPRPESQRPESPRPEPPRPDSQTFDPPRRVPPTAAAAPAPRPTGRELAPRRLPAGLERALSGLRAALPIVQKVLPVLDGQFLTALSNLIGPHHPAPATDLSPLETGLADLRLRHIELFNKVGEQNTALKRMVERLEKVQDAAERNALEQQELRESLESVGRKANAVAIGALALLAVSLAVNVFLFLHFGHAAR
jgi:hypothetical protein